MRKIVSVLNKSIDPGKAINALAHMSFGMGASRTKESCLMNYETSSGEEFPHISKRPFIILKATENKVKELVRRALEEKVEFTAFTEAMTVGSWEEQAQKSKDLSFDEQKFYGITLWGDSEKITEMTRKHSLWKV